VEIIFLEHLQDMAERNEQPREEPQRNLMKRDKEVEEVLQEIKKTKEE
jgi:hypothetical protein